MTYSFVWGVPRYLSSSFSAEGSLLSITCMRGYISSDMCFWNRELITCTLSKLGICRYYFSYSPYVTLRNENIKEAETNLTDKDDKRDIFFSLCAMLFIILLDNYLLLQSCGLTFNWHCFRTLLSDIILIVSTFLVWSSRHQGNVGRRSSATAVMN